MSPADWERQGACHDQDTNLWFTKATTAIARRMCQGCPVREVCLEAVLAREAGLGETRRHGVIAGLTGRERHRLSRQRAAEPQPAPTGS